MDRITVRPARAGQAFTVEGTRAKFTEPRTVPNTEYYRRAIAKGDLVLVVEPASKPGKEG